MKKALYIVIVGIKYLAVFSYAMELPPAKEKTVTLVSSEGIEFIVPRNAAQKAELIPAFATIGLEEGKTEKIKFSEIQSPILSKIARYILSLSAHKGLKRKALLDALEKDLPEGDEIALLKVADFLQFNSLIKVITRKIARQVEFPEQPTFYQNLTSNFWSQSKAIPLITQFEQNFKENNIKIVILLARYRRLFKGSSNKDYNNEFDDPLYKFSLRDYLEYQSEKFPKKEIRCESADFTAMQLYCLKGFNQLPNCQHIYYLYLDHNPLKELKSNTFVELPNLFHLSLSATQLHSIASDAFAGLTNLNKLNLENNALAHLEPNTFNGLQKLEILKLSRNTISEINPFLFNSLFFLQELDLSHNPLEAFLPGTFDSLQRLKQLKLGKTELKSFDTNIITRLGRLTDLVIETKQLSELEELRLFKAISQAKINYSPRCNCCAECKYGEDPMEL